MEEILKKLQDAIYNCDHEESERWAREAISRSIKPLRIIDEGLRPGLDRVGEAYASGEYALPEIVISGDAALSVSTIVEAALSSEEELPTKGSFAIGTVKGDIHSIGKNIVATMMRLNGFKVIDLGVDVSPDEFLEVADKVDVVGLSGLISVSINTMKETIKNVSAKYPDVIIIIGGAAIDSAVARTLGVLYGPDAVRAPEIVEEALNRRETNHS